MYINLGLCEQNVSTEFVEPMYTSAQQYALYNRSVGSVKCHIPAREQLNVITDHSYIITGGWGCRG